MGTINRITTSVLNNTTTSNIQNQRNNLLNITKQTTTGKKNQSYTDVAKTTTVKDYMDLSNQIDRKTNNFNLNTLLSQKLRTMDSSINSLQEILNKGLVLAQQAASPVSVGALPVEQLAQVLLTDIQHALNTQFNGQYIFSGSKISTQPVKNLDTNSNIVIGNATANYYLGDSAVQTQNLSDSTSIAYGISADNDAFQNLIAGLHMLISGYQNGNDLTLYHSGAAFLETATGKLSNLMAIVGMNEKSVLDQLRQDQSDLLILQEHFSNMDDVDYADAMIKLVEVQNSLQASYTATNKILNLRFADYLK